MRLPLPLKLGDVVELKKGHPCGTNRWEIIRVGADIRIKCEGCGRSVLLPRDRVERRIKRFLVGGPDATSRVPTMGNPPDTRSSRSQHHAGQSDSA